MARLLLLVIAVVDLSVGVVIENEVVRFEFCDGQGGLKSLKDQVSGKEFLQVDDPCSIPLWHFVVVSPGKGNVDISTKGTAVFGVLSEDKEKLTLTWKTVVFDDVSIQITMLVSLDSPTTPIASWDLSFEVISIAKGYKIGLWSVEVTIPSTEGIGEDGNLFFPSGLGATYRNPSTPNEIYHAYVHGDYPSGSASMQFMGLVSDSTYRLESGPGTAALYVGAHDYTSYVKTLAYSVTKISHQGSKNKILRSRRSRNFMYNNEVFNKTAHKISQSSQVFQILSVSINPPGAGSMFDTSARWKMPFPICVGIIRNVNYAEGRPLWYQASQVYKKYFADNAPWTKNSVSKMAPNWFLETSLWLNTHWQCHDVFNASGGDPDTVKEVIEPVLEVLDQPSVLLQWYEWQQGPNPSPSARYLFDTHYPDYFPPRGDNGGQGFKDAVTYLREKHNVYTFPYINGRLYDIHSDTYVQRLGKEYCTKNYRGATYVNEDGTPVPTVDVESYGSGATFCVARVNTDFWKSYIANDSLELLTVWGTGGVYIDQLAGAGPVLNWPDGGGSYWPLAQFEALDRIRLNKTLTEMAPLVTENIAEPFIDHLHGFLILTTIASNLAQQSLFLSKDLNGHIPPSYTRIAPAFASVYGGKYTAYGAIWLRSDWNDVDWFAAKLSASFVNGAQMGWFSLMGRTDNSNKCGPAGVADLLTSPDYQNCTKFIKLLASSRRTVLNYFLEGSLLPHPVLNPSPSVRLQSYNSKSLNDPLLDYDTVSASLWKGSNTLLLILVNNMHNVSYSGSAPVDLNLIELKPSDIAFTGFNLFSIDPESGKKTNYGSKSEVKASVSFNLAPYKVLLLEIVPFSV